MPKPKPLFTGPWYPWFVNDVLTSERVQCMSLVEEGAYRRAIDFAWKKGSIPSDPKLCAKTIGKGCTAKVAEVVLAMFEPHPKDPGRVINKKLEQIRKDQERKRKKKSDSGKLGMAKRWGRKVSGDNTVITPPITNDNYTDTDSEEEFKPRERARVPVREIFIGTVTSELTKRLDLKTLPAKLEWERTAEWAHTNGFTSDDVLECYDLLTRQHWRDGPVKPKHVSENLPNLNKLRKEIEKQKNGTSLQNGNRSSADQRAARAVEKRSVIAGVKARVAERERAAAFSGEDADHSS